MENNIILSPISLQDWQNVFDRSLDTAIEKHFKDFISPLPQAEKYLTRKETAVLLNVSLPTLNEYTKKGIINGERFGVRVLYKQSEIEASLTRMKYGREAHV